MLIVAAATFWLVNPVLRSPPPLSRSVVPSQRIEILMSNPGVPTTDGRGLEIVETISANATYGITAHLPFAVAEVVVSSTIPDLKCRGIASDPTFEYPTRLLPGAPKGEHRSRIEGTVGIPLVEISCTAASSSILRRPPPATRTYVRFPDMVAIASNPPGSIEDFASRTTGCLRGNSLELGSGSQLHEADRQFESTVANRYFFESNECEVEANGDRTGGLLDATWSSTGNLASSDDENAIGALQRRALLGGALLGVLAQVLLDAFYGIGVGAIALSRTGSIRRRR
ncbi:MAG: hypothetical protein HY828_22185 [Actinobacteria bacterium]|nr:hypothetical protein [Actinomycetota bacterium]